MKRRLVDADALKKKFAAQIDKITKEKKYGWEFTVNGFNGAMFLTGTEAAQNGVGWIPCSERLPDKTDKYLVTVNKNGEMVTTLTVWLNQENPKWASLDDVLAWQPLPTPWEGGQDEVN